MEIVAQLRNINKALYFLLYLLISLGIVVATNQLLITDDLYYDSLSNQMSFERITEFINTTKRFEWIIYIIIPIYLSFKFFVVASCLSVGTLLFGYQIEFKKLYQIALFADIIFIIPPVIKIICFTLIFADYTLSDIQFFFPLSALSLFNPEDVERWLIYPLQILNLFEVLYCAALAFGLKVVLKQSFSRMLGLVLSSYGLFLLLWIVFITFITINLS